MRASLLSLSAAALLIIAAPVKLHAVGSDDGSPATSSATTGAYSTAKKLVDAKQYNEAIPVLVKLVEAEPRNANEWNLLAFANRKLNHLDHAARYYERALKINPRHLGALEYQGELFLAIGQPDLAKANLQKLKTLCGSCEEWEDLRDAIRAAGV